MTLFESLMNWFRGDFPETDSYDVETVIQLPMVAEIRLSTEYFTYTITADTQHGESFLGGTCFDRIRRTTHDLPEGPASVETWDRIAEAIEENELISIRPPPGRMF